MSQPPEPDQPNAQVGRSGTVIDSTGDAGDVSVRSAEESMAFAYPTM